MKPLALYEAHAGSDETVKSEPDLPQLQQQFYAHAERFIEANKDRPFFVELALSAPHLPEHPHAPFDSSTFAGPYGAVVQEIDSIVGRLLTKLKELKLERDTVVVFTSDNGPWFEGSPGWLRERKGGGGFDGGYRVPFIAWAPGRFPAGKRVSSMISGIDLLPTFRAMAGLPPLEGVTMDGRDITKVLAEGAASPHAELVLFDNETPIAIRTQDWKYIDGIYYRANRFPMSLMGYQELFDLKADPSENYSVAETYPDVARDMKARLDAAKTTFAPFKHKDIPPVFKALQAQMRGLPD
jgi:arylsulfatase A-like enzyme